MRNKVKFIIHFVYFFSIFGTIYAPSPCDNPIYCSGNLLKTIQSANIFEDSRTFVNSKLKISVSETVSKFKQLTESSSSAALTKEQVQTFVSSHFEEANELEEWRPSDYSETPAFLNDIADVGMRQFASSAVKIWPQLFRKVKQEVFTNSEQYSLIPVSNGFVLPGGSYTEQHYWNTHWIVKGLLVSDMHETVKGILNNYVSLIQKYGYVPNTRKYYVGRTEAPLLCSMVKAYMEKVQDISWLKENIQYLEQELQYWVSKKTVQVTMASQSYTLAHYETPCSGPRPERYSEDVRKASTFSQSKREEYYTEVMSSQESGWGISSRWFANQSSTTSISSVSSISSTSSSGYRCRPIIPVDLNAILCGNFRTLSEFYGLIGDKTKGRYWYHQYSVWLYNIDKVLWDRGEESWYDYDTVSQKSRKSFYVSNLTPLWTKSFADKHLMGHGQHALNYLKKNGIFNYGGGIPASLSNTGLQWDFPNALAPLQSIVIEALENSQWSEAQTAARTFAKQWIISTKMSFEKHGVFFENYDSRTSGEAGTGVQTTTKENFAWSIAVTLDFVKRYHTYSSFPPACGSEVYCSGKLLDAVQQSNMFTNSHDFVRYKMKSSEKQTLSNFNTVLKSSNRNPSKEHIETFVSNNFESSTELEHWQPPDYSSNLGFIENIKHSEVKKFASSIHQSWPKLFRKVKAEVFKNSEQYTTLSVPNPFVLPNIKSSEFYYWGSYWSVRGLLVSKMYNSVRNILDNYVYLIKKYGFVPHGGRKFQLNRSGPPQFTAMVYDYYKKVQDDSWLRENIHYLDEEMTYWLREKTVKVMKKSKHYNLAHYYTRSCTPRPEHYSEDVDISKYFSNVNKDKVYFGLNCASESGWDFSSRWLFGQYSKSQSYLYNVHGNRVIPVDLNAILCGNFKYLGELYLKLGNSKKSTFWHKRHLEWRKSIDAILWHKKDNIWYDYDYELLQSRKQFYPTNLTPLWTKSIDLKRRKTYGKHAVNYLKKSGMLNYNGGIPTSLLDTGRKWDYPNVSPPLQSIVVGALQNSEHTEAMSIAKTVATKWVTNTMKSYKSSGALYEHYDARNVGSPCVVCQSSSEDHFAWTAGVTLDFIHSYYK